MRLVWKQHTYNTNIHNIKNLKFIHDCSTSILNTFKTIKRHKPQQFLDRGKIDERPNFYIFCKTHKFELEIILQNHEILFHPFKYLLTKFTTLGLKFP